MTDDELLSFNYATVYNDRAKVFMGTMDGVRAQLRTYDFASDEDGTSTCHSVLERLVGGVSYGFTAFFQKSE